MAQATRIQPDIEFIKELQSVGGDSLKKCYQCATCSVVCPISPASQPFPRKEMIWAQWGLKDKLVNNMDIWLCHNCGTCSDLCPRGAKPGDLLSALRNMSFQNLVGPKAFGKWMSAPKYLPIIIGIPAILFLIVWAIRANIVGGFFPTEADGSIVFGNIFYGDYTIDPIFMLVTAFVAFTFFSGVMNLIKGFEPYGSVLHVGEKRKHWVRHLLDVIFGEILPHKKFTECGDDKSDRKIGHMALLFGFIFLAVVTSAVAIGHWGGAFVGGLLGGDQPEAGAFAKMLFGLGELTHTPLSQGNVIKIVANIGAVLLVIGLAFLTVSRLVKDEKASVSSYYDWYLLGVIWAVTLTGIGSQLLRLAELKYLAFPMYYLHLVSVFMLFAYLPWSKLGHLVYRTAAITYARYMGRKTL